MKAVTERLAKAYQQPGDVARDVCIFGGLGLVGLGFGMMEPAWGLVVVGAGLFGLGRWGT